MVSKVFNASRLGVVVVSGVIATLPLATGCGPAPRTGGHALNETNSRIAYVVTEDEGGAEGDMNDRAVVVGSASATISADGTVANFTTNTNDIHDQENVARNSGAFGELYGDSQLIGGLVSHNVIQVERINDIDQDGTPDDTFLTFHHNNPNSPGRTEFARGYHGTRTDVSVIDRLRGRSSHTATYRGVGQVDGGQGAAQLALDGDLEMTVRFTGETAGIDGSINVNTPTGPTNPSGFDQVLFSGEILGGTADYDITDIRITRAGVDQVEFTRQAGVGSFFGQHAGGTIGVFAGSGQTTGAHPSQVNILGSFHGSTTDNNPR
jgi:hypothetical protein